MTAEKLDLFKKHKDEYLMPRKPAFVRTGPARYLTIQGKGQPGGELFQACIGALYGAAYTIKMTRKMASRDYKVATLEGLWWGEKKNTPPCITNPADWNWKLMIRVPTFIGKADLDAAKKVLREKGKADAAKVCLEDMDEGECVQMLHVGSYEAEQASIDQMMAYVASQGRKCKGPHHEIYLSDPRRVPPERLRTILRYPLVSTSRKGSQRSKTKAGGGKPAKRVKRSGE